MVAREPLFPRVDIVPLTPRVENGSVDLKEIINKSIKPSVCSVVFFLTKQRKIKATYLMSRSFWSIIKESITYLKKINEQS